MDNKVVKNKKTKRRKKINWKFVGNCVIILFLTAFLATGIAGVVFIMDILADSPKLNVEDFDSRESSTIYDNKGEFIMDIGVELRENVRYEDMPQAVIDAFVSIEDSRYFTHNGFDMPRFMAAAINNLKSMDFSQGGSTFTMQMIKNTYFLEEGSGGAVKSVERKLQEIFLAMEANSKVDKKTVFEGYVNKINFGGPARGIQKASQYYFGKDIQDIGLNEAALLAGVINAPNYYNPFLNLETATERRNEVLNMMYYHGYIDEFELEIAKTIKVEDILLDTYEVEEVIPYQAYVDHVITEVIEITGKDPYEVPMKIYTGMDRYAQEVTEKAQIGGYSDVQINAHEYLDSAVVATNNKGEIVVIGGGKEYHGTGQRLFNKATEMGKQSGSTMKGILSYPFAFEYLGMTTGSYVEDTPRNFPGTNTRIINWNNKYSGIITIEEALVDSRNVPAIDLLNRSQAIIGAEGVVNYLNSIGFDYVTMDNYSQLVGIGGGDFETNPLQMAGAYGIITNKGQYIEPHAVTRIEFSDNTPTYIASFDPVQALSEQAAYLASRLLIRTVDTCETVAYCRLRRSHDVVSKSGTTDWGSIASAELDLPISNGSKDKWMVSGTTQFTIAAWVGFDIGIVGEDTYYSQSLINKHIDGYLTERILDALEKSVDDTPNIAKPDDIGSATFIKGYSTHYEPVEGMSDTYITSGLNKGGSTVLSVFQIPEVGQFDPTLYTVTPNIDPSVGIDVVAPIYPITEYLTVASKTAKFNFGGKNYTGDRGNDITWWMGVVGYYTEIRKPDGTLVYTHLSSPSNTSTINFLDITEQNQAMEPVPLTDGETLQACSYYAFTKMLDNRSNEACLDFTYHAPTIPEPPVDPPVDPEPPIDPEPETTTP